MERFGSYLRLNKTEQDILHLPEEVHVDMATDIMDKLILKISRANGHRSVLYSHDTYEMHPAERQTQTIALENRLTALDSMKRQLGELAGAEIVDASVRCAEEFKGLIDFTRLHQK